MRNIQIKSIKDVYMMNKNNNRSNNRKINTATTTKLAIISNMQQTLHQQLSKQK